MNEKDSIVVSFEESTAKDICLTVHFYKKELIDKEYILISTKMPGHKYFLITGKNVNFLHLTGVKTHLKPNQFYSYALSNRLTVDHIFIPNKSVKGSVRRKRKSLFCLKDFFKTEELYIQECFKKNKVYCKLATTNKKCTLGFIQQKNKLVPNTLLKNDELDVDSRYAVDLILSKEKGADLFDTLVKGSIDMLNCYDEVDKLISKNIKKTKA